MFIIDDVFPLLVLGEVEMGSSADDAEKSAGNFRIGSLVTLNASEHPDRPVGTIGVSKSSYRIDE